MAAAYGLNSYSTQQYAFMTWGLTQAVTLTAGVAKTISLNVTTTAQPPTQVCCYNPSSVAIFIAFGTNTVTTGLTSGMPIVPANATVAPTLTSYSLRGAGYAAVQIAATSTGTFYITTGEGRI